MSGSVSHGRQAEVFGGRVQNLDIAPSALSRLAPSAPPKLPPSPRLIARLRSRGIRSPVAPSLFTLALRRSLLGLSTRLAWWQLWDQAERIPEQNVAAFDL